MAKKKKKKKLAVRHRNKKGQFSKRGKRERVYSQAVTIIRRIARRERAQERERKRKEKQHEVIPIPFSRVQDFLVVFSKTGYDDVSFTVTALDEEQAFDFIRNDMLNTDNGKKLLRSFRHSAMSFDPPRYRPQSDIGYIGERE